MEYTNLSAGSTLRISRLVFGCEPLGGTDWGAVDIPAVKAAAIAAWDSGINCFDTAPVYGLGESERNLRDALGSRIKDAVVSTKIGLSWISRGTGGRACVYRDARPASIQRSVEDSLRRLGVERLALVFIHWPDPGAPLEDTMEALSRLREQGKIGEIGVSNFAPEQIRRAHRLMALSTAQVQYSLLRRESAVEIVPTCRSFGVGVMAWGVLAQGLLTGKYSSDTQFAANDRRRVHPNFDSINRERCSSLAAKLRTVSERHAALPAQVAIRWALDQPGVCAGIVGIKTRDQLRDMLAAADLRLDAEDYLALEADSASDGITATENANAN